MRRRSEPHQACLVETSNNHAKQPAAVRGIRTSSASAEESKNSSTLRKMACSLAFFSEGWWNARVSCKLAFLPS